MKNIGILLLLAFGLASCQDDVKKNEPEGKYHSFAELYNDAQLKSDFFEFDATKNTTLISKNGTTIKIYANSFVTKDGAEVTGTVKLEIKEAIKPVDFVLANLTTTSNGQNLSSGGMIYLNAVAGNKELDLKKGSEIGVFVPTNSLDEGMMIYSGERDSANNINWKSPEPILNSKLRTLEQSYITITYQYFGNFNSGDKKFTEWLWKSNRKVGDRIKVDTVEVKVVDIEKNMVALREAENGLFIPDVIANKGQNGFVDDYNTSYIFSVKKLGWANIDRLFNDPKSAEVEMLATINNHAEFGHVFISLILPEHKMYIPGYQKMDNSFGFTHDDAEQLVLPVGSKATIMATAYKEDKPYFSLQTLVIERNMNISFALQETTAEGLKKALEENL